MAEYTPMIKQYLEIKGQYPDAFLFFRLGDFYELFFEDAVEAAKELEITLTGRAGGTEERIPMCGVPYHSSMQYIKRLIEKGYKVAICEQVEDPKAAKGIVQREVVRVITPGTLIEEGMLGTDNNYVVSIAKESNGGYGFVAGDISTGEIHGTLVSSFSLCLEELSQFRVAEVIYDTSVLPLVEEHRPRFGQATLTPIYTAEDQRELTLKQQMLALDVPHKLRVSLTLLHFYLVETQKQGVQHLKQVSLYERQAYVQMDHYSRRNLELTETIREKSKRGSLLWLLDQTTTALGARQLHKWLQRPLMDLELITQRLDAVESFIKDPILREELQDSLKEVYDLERLVARVAYGNVSPKDLLQLKRSLAVLPQMTEQLGRLTKQPILLENFFTTDLCADLVQLLEDAIREDAPLQIKEGGIFKKGYHEQLDQYTKAKQEGKQWIAKLEAREREATGIKSLKVGYNKVFGYYLEVTKSNLAALPEGRYERKQTLANAERFVTQELKEYEILITEANEKLSELEYDLFLQLREVVASYLIRIQRLAELVATLDVVLSLAEVSERYRFSRPSFTLDRQLVLKEARHPVVEKVVGESSFVANDLEMGERRRILLITGPNMAGKSTYMRQTALIVIMAQIGCFVPAAEAKLPLFDQIFTRIGAADDLVGGQSTFMVEMLETQRAITQATPQSLILLDEIGRGTSTYDGMSLAQAVIEYIHAEVKALTLFSTHYHELTSLDQQLAELQNIHVACTEQDGRVVFLHKVKPGKADRSYGIHVAELAQMPEQLIARAREILVKLEETGPQAAQHQQTELQHTQAKHAQLDNQHAQLVIQQAQSGNQQLSFGFNEQQAEKELYEIKQRLEELDLLHLSPFNALQTLFELQQLLKVKEKQAQK